MNASEINEALAVKVMGSDNDLCESGTRLYSIGNKFVFKRDWNPMQNLSQAMQCLEKFGFIIRTSFTPKEMGKQKYYEISVWDHEGIFNWCDAVYWGENNQPLSEVICHAVMKAIGG